MPFVEPFETYYKMIIKPAIDENGLYAVRGDSLFRSTHIMDDIWDAIKSSSLVVAELTGKNPNVYYELGLAHALKKPAILISDNIEDVPFDLRPLRVLIYDKNDPDWGNSLRTNITKAIDETLSSPTEAIPHTFRDYELPETREEATLVDRISILENHVNELIIDSFSYNSELNKVVDIEVYSVGQRVVHPKFGAGTIIGYEADGTLSRVQVDFDYEGLKWLVTKYAKLSRE